MRLRRLPDIINNPAEHDFTQVPNEMLRDPELSAKAKGLLCLLLTNKQGEWYSYQETLQQMMSDGETAIRSGLKELEEVGYLLRLKYRDIENKKFAGSIWCYSSLKNEFDLSRINRTIREFGVELIDCERSLEPAKKTVGGKTTYGNPTCGNTTYGNPRPNNTNTKNTNFKNTNILRGGENSERLKRKNVPVKDKLITPSMFDQFWSIYPRKVDKGKAKTKWNQICNKPDRPSWHVIQTAIAAQVQSPRWQEAKFIPHPTTWLNQQRWLDDPDEMVIYGKDELPPKLTNPKQLILDRFGHLQLTSVFTVQCLIPATELIDSPDNELIPALIKLYDEIENSQAKCAPLQRSLLPSPMTVLGNYLCWLGNNDWINNITLSALNTGSGLFRQYRKYEASCDSYFRDPLTGKSNLEEC